MLLWRASELQQVGPQGQKLKKERLAAETQKNKREETGICSP